MGNPKHLMWIDVETTDLDPHKGKLLEVALVLTRFDDDFSLLHTFETEISLTEISLRDIYPRTDPIIIEMHNKNGLWNTCLNSSMNLRFVKDHISDFLNDCENIFDDVDLSETPLAGSGVHFDREWLNAHLDVAARRFSHKNFDVSTLKMAARAWADYDKLFPQEPPDHHRAMADVKSSIDTALRIRQLLTGKGINNDGLRV